MRHAEKSLRDDNSHGNDQRPNLNNLSRGLNLSHGSNLVGLLKIV